ncbi:MAG: gliding motility-associated ABC transporter permease subunit GldF [Bacteroidota bacterium]
MITLLKKEINNFFGSIIGYIVIGVFLIINGLFLWVFPLEFNILDGGYSSVDGLFVLAPWVFLFLIPAITMRSFADEKKMGTIELLLTKPITDMQLVLSKFFAGVILVFLSVLPSLIYYFTVYYLGSPVGNIDSGGTWGSYIGLFFLASSFVSVGLFSSSITDNQVVSFIIAVTLCLLTYIGFEFIYSLDLFGGFDLFIKNMGISAHYSSMSRGVIDTRDVIYFGSLMGLFLLLTRISIQKRKW